MKRFRIRTRRIVALCHGEYQVATKYEVQQRDFIFFWTRCYIGDKEMAEQYLKACEQL